MRVQCKIYGKHAHTSSQRLQPHDDGPARRHLGDQRLRGSSCLDRSYGDAGSHVPYDAYGGHFTFLIKKLFKVKEKIEGLCLYLLYRRISNIHL